MTLKEKILKNEQDLLDKFSDKYGLAIKYFMAKIKSLPTDGDIVKFLNNPSILSIKKKQYELFHSNGFKTAVDIMRESDTSNLTYAEFKDLEEGDLLNALTICSLANNFNHQKGMYYNSLDDIVILKTQIKNGQYSDKWVIRNKQLLYYLESEKYDYLYNTKNFSHLPNQVCRDIICGINKTTKVYVFYRYNRGDRYFFAGEFLPVEFTENNRAIILNKK